MDKPRCYCYMDYASGNYGINSMAFEDPKGNTYYYSYQTLIGFHSRVLGKSYFIKNYWGPTTGKHLNKISRKEERLDRAEFDCMVKLAFGDKEVQLYQVA